MATEPTSEIGAGLVDRGYTAYRVEGKPGLIRHWQKNVHGVSLNVNLWNHSGLGMGLDEDMYEVDAYCDEVHLDVALRFLAYTIPADRLLAVIDDVEARLLAAMHAFAQEPPAVPVPVAPSLRAVADCCAVRGSAFAARVLDRLSPAAMGRLSEEIDQLPGRPTSARWMFVPGIEEILLEAAESVSTESAVFSDP